MPTPTFILLGSTSLTSGSAANVTFSNIPLGYKDLIVKISARSTRSGQPEDGLAVAVNGSGGTTWTLNSSNGSSNLSGTLSSLGYGAAWMGRIPAATATANSFGNYELLLADYSSSNDKTYFCDSITENNSSNAAYITQQATYYASTLPITSLTFGSANASLAQYSTFSLYGIRNY